MILNFREALNILCDSHAASHPFFPVSFEMSQILYDQFGQAAYMKKLATEIMALGPRYATEVELESKRISLLNFLSDGCVEKYTGNSSAEKVIWASQVVSLCRDYILDSNRVWMNYNSRFKEDAFQEINPTLRDQLHRYLDKLTSSLDTESFARNVLSVMKNHMDLDENSKEPHCLVM